MTTVITLVMRWYSMSIISFGTLLLSGGAMLYAWWAANDVVHAISVVAALVSGLLLLVALERVGQSLRNLQVQNTFHAHTAFTALYERSPVAYIILDTKGRMILANTAAVHLLVITIDTISEHNVLDFITDTEEISKAVLSATIARGGLITDQEFMMQTLTGDTKWVYASLSTTDDPSQRLLSLVDMTEEKAVDTAKSEFVALATHQLRTPIAAIRWNVELLSNSLAGTVTEKQAKYLEKVSRNVLRMLHLINDFLSVSKLEMGTYAAEAEVVELQSYLEEILNEFEEKISQKQLQVTSQLNPTDITIKSDRRLLHIILSNLISNAVKYSRDQGAVTISATAANGSLSIAVSDSGIGIPADEQSMLFTKFYRATNAQQQESEGTGLGLYVVQQSAEILGGSVTMESTLDSGSRFVVQLPSVVVRDE